MSVVARRLEVGPPALHPPPSPAVSLPDGADGPGWPATAPGGRSPRVCSSEIWTKPSGVPGAALVMARRILVVETLSNAIVVGCSDPVAHVMT
jgi:hypothetical protein